MGHVPIEDIIVKISKVEYIYIYIYIYIHIYIYIYTYIYIYSSSHFTGLIIEVNSLCNVPFNNATK